MKKSSKKEEISNRDLFKYINSIKDRLASENILDSIKSNYQKSILQKEFEIKLKLSNIHNFSERILLYLNLVREGNLRKSLGNVQLTESGLLDTYNKLIKISNKYFDVLCWLNDIKNKCSKLESRLSKKFSKAKKIQTLNENIKKIDRETKEIVRSVNELLDFQRKNAVQFYSHNPDKELNELVSNRKKLLKEIKGLSFDGLPLDKFGNSKHPKIKCK